VYHPDWFYAMTPPGWMERPLEFEVYERNVLPNTSGATTSVELIFSKVCDTLVFGGSALVTLTDNATILCPLSAVSTGYTARLSQPSKGDVYSQSFSNSTPTQGFVPLENLFAVWQTPGQRPVFWPIPIAVPVGGALLLDLIDVRGAADANLRFTFTTACIMPAGGMGVAA